MLLLLLNPFSHVHALNLPCLPTNQATQLLPMKVRFAALERNNRWRSLGIGDLQDFPVLMGRTPLLRWEIVLSLTPGISESELGRVALASHYQFQIISLPPSFTNLSLLPLKLRNMPQRCI